MEPQIVLDLPLDTSATLTYQAVPDVEIAGSFCVRGFIPASEALAEHGRGVPPLRRAGSCQTVAEASCSQKRRSVSRRRCKHPLIQSLSEVPKDSWESCDLRG